MNHFWTPARTLALLVVCTYIGFGYAFGGAEGAVRVLSGCLLPLYCVWFPDGAGTYYGCWRGTLHRPTPPVMVSIGGWLLLAMPPIFALIWFMSMADR